MLVLIIVGTEALSATEIAAVKCCFQGLTVLSASLNPVYLYQVSNIRL